MIVIKIRTWKCEACGYTQDLDPKSSPCPSCESESGLTLLTDPNSMHEATFLEQSDIDNTIASMKADVPATIFLGTEQYADADDGFKIKMRNITRPETSEEKATRIQQYIDTTVLQSPEEIQSFRDQYEYVNGGG